MQDLFDMRTLTFVSGFTSLILFFCMLYIWRHQKTYPGFLHWTFASLTNAVGMILISQRGFLPDAVTVVLADVLLMVAMLVILDGLIRFAGQKQQHVMTGSFLLVFCAAMVCFTYAWPSFTLRVVTYSILQAFLCLATAYVAYRYIPLVLPDRDAFYYWFFIFSAAFPIMRIIATIAVPEKADELMTSGFLHQAVVLVGLEVYVIADIGLIILNAQRINYELQKAKNEIRTLTGFIPICANCKKIRDDKGSWNQLEAYITDHVDVEFSHGICPDCMKKLYPGIVLDEDTETSKKRADKTFAY